MGIGGGGNATYARRRVDDTPSTRALVHTRAGALRVLPISAAA